jgi:hypothetical protein
MSLDDSAGRHGAASARLVVARVVDEHDVDVAAAAVQQDSWRRGESPEPRGSSPGSGLIDRIGANDSRSSAAWRPDRAGRVVFRSAGRQGSGRTRTRR